MNCNTAPSILKLKELREELCKKKDNRDEIFKTLDIITIELNLLKDMVNNPESARECLSKKIDCLLVLLDPDIKKGAGEEK